MELLLVGAVWYLWRQLQAVRREVASIRSFIRGELPSADSEYLAKRRAVVAANGRVYLGFAAGVFVLWCAGAVLSGGGRDGDSLTPRWAVEWIQAGLILQVVAMLAGLVVGLHVLPARLARRIPSCPRCGKTGERPICGSCGLLLD